MDEGGLDELLSPQGQELLGLIAAENLVQRRELTSARRTAPATSLQLGTRLRRTYPPRLVSAALELWELRVRARSKFSLADGMYFTREGLEQASAESVSRHRARRFDGIECVADLCAGIGGDFISLAAGRRVLAVDLNPLHLRMAELNARVYNPSPDLHLHAGDVRDADLSGVHAVFVDPARRRGGTRELHHEASSPPLSWCLALAERVPAVGIKAAPGLPWASVPPGWEAEFVSVGGNLKEAALWSPALATARTRATLLPGGHTLLPKPGPDVECRMPGRYLLDPDPAVTRAGLVEELARLLGAWKLDPLIAFLSADVPMHTPFGRLLLVEDSLPWNLKRLRERLRELDIGVIDIRKRGSAVDVDDIRRRLKLSGNRRATVVLTRVGGKPWALVCRDE